MGMKKAQILFLTLCSSILFFSLYFNRDMIVDAKNGVNSDLANKNSSTPDINNRVLSLNKYDYERWFAKQSAQNNESQLLEAQQKAESKAKLDAKRRIQDDKKEESKEEEKEENKRDLDGSDSNKDEKSEEKKDDKKDEEKKDENKDEKKKKKKKKKKS